MPVPVIVGPGAIVAAKHLAYQAAASVDVTTFASATTFTLLLYWCFSRLPDWIKQDISFRSILKDKKDVSKEEITGLLSVVEKIQNHVRHIRRNDSVTEIPQLHAALLSFVQLSGQHKLEQINNGVQQIGTATQRDTAYQSAGTEIPMSEVRSEELQMALTMATWAYYEDSMILTEKLLEHDYTLLRHHLVVRPGTVAHYIAVSPSKRQVVVGLRGTSSLEDIMTDCCGRAVPLVDDYSLGDKISVEVKAKVPHVVMDSLEEEVVEIVSGHERIICDSPDDESDDYIRCHEGILIAARGVMDEIGRFLRDYLLECKYRVIFCGHSLGAGAAVVSAVLLRSRYPELFLNDDHHRRIHVYGFGPPPVLDFDSAIGARAYCTTVVYNSDLISRLNVSNLVVLLACLRKIQVKLAERGMNPTGPVTTLNFVNKLAEGAGGEPLLSLSELQQTVREAHSSLRRPEHLFLPGRVLLVYNPWRGEKCETESPTCSTVRPECEEWKCVETTGTSPIFHSLEIDGVRCFTDHLTSSYFQVMGMQYQF